MSGADRPRDREVVVKQRGDRAQARVEVSFELRGSGRPQVAAAAAELIDRLQELANRSGCDCDLDVSMGWQAGSATRPAAAPQQPARPAANGR